MKLTAAVIVGVWAGSVATHAAMAPTARQAPTPRQDYSAGSYLYRTFCATCHGVGGTGDGPTAPILRTPPPDLTRLSARAGGRFPRDRVLAAIDGRRTPRAHGPAEMPIWGDVLRSTEGHNELVIRQRIEALAAHLESIQVR